VIIKRKKIKQFLSIWIGGKMRYGVLLVDDDPSVRHTVSRILKSAHVNIKSVTSGRECLKELERGFKGLILMDIVMPEMDGWDTIKEIVDRGRYKDIIICMLTGKEEPDIKMDRLKEYVLDYIRKPFDTIKFVELVKEYLSYLK